MVTFVITALLALIVVAYVSGVRIRWRGWPVRRVALSASESVTVTIGHRYNATTSGRTWREFTIAYNPSGAGGAEEARTVLAFAVPLADSAGDSIIAVEQRNGSSQATPFSTSRIWRFQRPKDSGPVWMPFR
jgi:hypothetical protein